MVRLARRRAGVSQRELARRMGRKQSVVARWESGATQPSWDVVGTAVRACGFDLDIRVTSRDPDLERLLREQLARTPADRVTSVVNAARLRRA